VKKLTLLIPFKASGEKSRLSSILSAKQRREFSLLMLLDLLEALESVNLLSSSFVVSSGKKALAVAEEVGASGLQEPSDRGVNSAINWAIRKLEPRGDVMVLPSDLPTLMPREIVEAITPWAQGLQVVLSPSRSFDGTNMLLFSTLNPVPLSYDVNSFWNHIAGVASHGLSLAVYAGGGFLFDVDTPDDFRALAASHFKRHAVYFARRALS
jgi:2-phospho-L-lactate guanylyltransferase